MIVWDGCYDASWNGEIIAEAFSHPAKFSRALIQRIYGYMLEQDWLKPGDVVLDCFGGVGLGAKDSAEHGIMWIGIELEKHFQILAQRNIILWSERWCCCGENDKTYLQELRERIREIDISSRGKGEEENRSILQSGMQKSLWEGKEDDRRTEKESYGKNTMEQGEIMVESNEEKIIQTCEQRIESNGKERKLEGGALDKSIWVCNNQGEREAETRTHIFDGEKNREENLQKRSGSSHQWRQGGQQNRKSQVDDNIRAHENSSSEWNRSEIEKENMPDLRKGIHGKAQFRSMQREMPNYSEEGILAAARREKEGAYCPKCGKLIVPFPKILQGDSRKLGEVIASASGVISSPPFGDQEPQNDKEFCAPHDSTGNLKASYGSTPGNLGNMKPGDVASVISSPPFEQTIGHDGGKEHLPKIGNYCDNYGTTPGQLGSMKAGDVDGVISSPPFEDSVTVKPINDEYQRERMINRGRNPDVPGLGLGEYGNTEGQLGQENGDTFWQAAREILLQCHAVLKPGAMTAWVVKGYIKGGKLVDFPGNWRRLCESCGFEFIEEIHASLVKEEVQGVSLFTGEMVKRRVERKSFFAVWRRKMGLRQ